MPLWQEGPPTDDNGDLIESPEEAPVEEAPEVDPDAPTSPLWDAEDPPEVFTWKSPRTGATVRLVAAGDVPYGVMESALDTGEAGMAMVLRDACLTEDDRTALRALRMREAEKLIAAWLGGVSLGESASSAR